MAKFTLINGVRFPIIVTEEAVNSFANYQLRPDDVIVATYPKSGTNWSLQILKLIRNGGEEDNINPFDPLPWMEVVGREKCDVCK